MATGLGMKIFSFLPVTRNNLNLIMLLYSNPLSSKTGSRFIGYMKGFPVGNRSVILF